MKILLLSSLFFIVSCGSVVNSKDIGVNFSADISYKDKQYIFDENVLCKHEIYRHEGDGFKRHDKWYLSRHNLYKELDNGEVILLQLPIVCRHDGKLKQYTKDFFPTVTIKKTNGDLEFYYPPNASLSKNTEVNVSKLTIKPVGNMKSVEFYEDQKYSEISWNRDRYTKSSNHYYGYLAYVYGDVEIKNDIFLSRYLSNIKTVSVITDLEARKKIGRLKSHGYVETWGMSNDLDNFSNNYAMYYSYPLYEVEKGVYSLNKNKRSTILVNLVSKEYYRAKYKDIGLSIIYKDKIYNLRHIDSLYDPDERILIAPSFIRINR